VPPKEFVPSKKKYDIRYERSEAFLADSRHSSPASCSVLRFGGDMSVPVSSADFVIHSPIRQLVNGKSGIYQMANVVETELMTVDEFWKDSQKLEGQRSKRELQSVTNGDYEALQRAFWSNISCVPLLPLLPLSTCRPPTHQLGVRVAASPLQVHARAVWC
jgi:hypothetical protein